MFGIFFSGIGRAYRRSVPLLVGLLVLTGLAACKGTDVEPPVARGGPERHQAERPLQAPESLHAPEGARYVTPEVTLSGPHYGNLYYEANNIAMRGALDENGLPVDDGGAIADRWVHFAQQVGGVFVLRDSLFSQQDHPVKHRAKSLMLPPNWVTVAVSAARRGVELTAVQAPPLRDDAAWAVFATAEALFGGFPPSETLHREAIRPLTGAAPAARRRTTHAREALQALAGQSSALLEALPRGAQAVAETGAAIIADGDARYFGADVRQSRIIPIFVHNPTPREIAEGKGMQVPDDPRVLSEDIALATREVYARRLLEGDLAVERYDISQPEERAKAIALLAELLPRTESGAAGGHLWLWVTGPLEAGAKLVGENATAYIEEFRKEVDAAPIDTSRLRYLSKPRVVLPPGKSRQAAFDSTLERFRGLDLWFSIDLNSVTLQRLLRAPDDSNRAG